MASALQGVSAFFVIIAIHFIFGGSTYVDKHTPAHSGRGLGGRHINIVVFTSLLGLTHGEAISAWRFAGVPLSIISGIAVGALTGFVLAWLFKTARLRDSAKVIVLLGVAFLLATLEEIAGDSVPFSGLLAVMAVGVTLLRAAPDAAKRLSGKLSKLWVGAEILLFALVGASVNIGYASAAGFKTLALLSAVLCIRAVGIQLCLIEARLTAKERLFCALTWIPKATVQAAIGGIPLAMGLPSGGIILAVAVISILFTAPLGAFMLDSTYKRLLEKED